MSEQQKPQEKTHGIAHIFAAATYSISGAQRMWAETAFKHEVLAGIFIICVFCFVGATALQFTIAIILILLTLAMEALNTAIEEIVDLVSPEWSLPAKHAKDIASFAVLCTLLANAVFALFIIFFS